jgi:hypothetical protein
MNIADVSTTKKFQPAPRSDGPKLNVTNGHKPRFVLEPFEAISFEASAEWLVKRLIPRQGVGALFGASQSLKSFTAFDLAMHVTLGRDWADLRVTQAPVVYIAAEGAAGLRKRKVGFETAHADLPADVPFHMVAAAPNLGVGSGDLETLITSIETAGVKPGLIALDTLAQSLGGADENGAGMVQLVANATALANHFNCFVLIVHHVGLTDDKRLRGHTSLVGGLDVSILSERKEGMHSTVLTLQKLKDEESNLKFTVHLSRVVIAHDEDGDEISTLVVDRIEEGDVVTIRRASRSIPPGQRLLMEVVALALDEAGTIHKPFGDGPAVSVVAESAVRTRYYARMAEQAERGEDKKTLAERQRKAFSRALVPALKATMLRAGERDEQRILWLAMTSPSASSDLPGQRDRTGHVYRHMSRPVPPRPAYGERDKHGTLSLCVPQMSRVPARSDRSEIA